VQWWEATALTPSKNGGVMDILSVRCKLKLMRPDRQNRTYLLGVRLTSWEHDQIITRWHQSTCRGLGGYVRKILFGKRVTVRYRNQSLDDLMAELILLRSELNFIVHNCDQRNPLWEIISQHITEIKATINRIDDQWLQS
jgi:hypothetical protein